jgi:hypothetical protein
LYSHTGFTRRERQGAVEEVYLRRLRALRLGTAGWMSDGVRICKRKGKVRKGKERKGLRPSRTGVY